MNETFKMVMLPTGDKSKIGFLSQKGKEWNDLRFFEIESPNILDSENQHLYVISDDEVVEDDFGISPLNEVVKIGKNFTKSLYRKIIATTDKTLNLPMISDSILEAFVKAHNEGKEIEVEYNKLFPMIQNDNLKIS